MVSRRSKEELPRYRVSLHYLGTTSLDLTRFGKFEKIQDITFPKKLKVHALNWCMAYEELLRRLFPECRVFHNKILSSEHAVLLNPIDAYSSKRIAQFLLCPSPSKLKRLFHTLRHYRGSPDVIAIIVCRNLGLGCRRIVNDSELKAFWAQREKELFLPISMPTRNSRRRLSTKNKVFYVRLELSPPVFLFGQASPFTPAVIIDLLGDKSATSQLLSELGFRTPQHVVVRQESDFKSICACLPCSHVILKPLSDSNRVGVIGPIRRDDLKLLRQCFRRCRKQISNGPMIIICEEYVQGAPVRINCNHGRITFVATSVRNKVIGDGTSTIRELLARKRCEEDAKFNVVDAYLENVLIGQGLCIESVPAKGETIYLSHDGNEEGYFQDMTKTFGSRHKKVVLQLSKQLRCPVIGVDAILDHADCLWIVDVNTNPGIDFFGSTARAYETMEHMISAILTAQETAPP